MGKGRRPRAAIDRFLEKTTQADNGCIEWTASRNNHGYGTFAVGGGKSTVAHRWAYEHFVGLIPEGMTIDHLCRNRACVNVDHLESVTHRTNLLRAETVTARNAAKTHCPFGHPYSGDNLYLPPSGGRQCHTCIHRRSLARAVKNRKAA